MHPELRDFLTRLAGVVGATLLAVIVAAFLSVPLSIGRHPGDAPAPDAAQLRHMT